MRILRLITRMNGGGPARTILAIEPLLRQQGVDTLLVTGTVAAGEEDLAKEARRRGIRLEVLPHLGRSLGPWSDWRAGRALARIVRRFQPDVVHSHTFKAGLLGRLLPRNLPARRVHTFHGHLFRGYFASPVSAALVRLERWLAHRSHGLVTVSPALREELATRYRIAPADRFHVIPGVVTREDPEPDLAPVGGEDSHPWVGCVARLVPIKAPGRFLDLAEDVRRERPDVRFVWVGDGRLRAPLQAQIRRRGLEDAVRLMGWQGRTSPWHARFQVEVLLSESEGLPVSLLEARALGTPVVASRVGGVPDLIEDGVDGWLVPPGDRPAAARAVLQALEDPEEAQARAGRAKRRDQDRYSPENHARRLMSLYGGLLNS